MFRSEVVGFTLAAFRGLQALSVQFRFAFSKPSSCGARRSSPTSVATKKSYFSTNLRFEGWILETILLFTISTLQNANRPKNKIFCSDRSGATSAGAATGRFRKRVCELDGLENANLNWTLNACSPRFAGNEERSRMIPSPLQFTNITSKCVRLWEDDSLFMHPVGRDEVFGASDALYHCPFQVCTSVPKRVEFRRWRITETPSDVR